MYHPYAAIRAFVLFVLRTKLPIKWCYYVAVKTFYDPEQTQRELDEWVAEVEREQYNKRIEKWKSETQ